MWGDDCPKELHPIRMRVLEGEDSVIGLMTAERCRAARWSAFMGSDDCLSQFYWRWKRSVIGLSMAAQSSLLMGGEQIIDNRCLNIAGVIGDDFLEW